MAGDWIKMRSELQSHPKVVRILSATHADKFRVIGGLHAVWAVFDTHSTDGTLFGYTPESMDHVIGWDGFSAAMEAVGWLLFDGEQTLTLPEFDEHNSKGAKRRAEDQKRKRNLRRDADNAPPNDGQDADTKRAREREREEALKASSHSPRAGEREDGEPSSDVQVTDGDGNPLDVPLATLTAAQSAVVVQACKHLRRMGLQGVHPERIELVRMVRGGATVATMALVAAELTMRAAEKANAQCLRGLDPPPDPDLPELLASAATAEQMHLRPEELIELKSFTPNLAYLASTLEGRWRDAQNLTTGGIRHGSGDEAGRGAGRDRRSLVERVRSNAVAGDERDRLADSGDLRGVG